MAKATILKMISFTLPNKAGQLAAVSELLAGARLSIQAFSASDSGATAGFTVAVKSAVKAKKALASLGVEIKEQGALCVEMPNEPGRLHKVTKKLADAGINIQSSWATAFTGKTARGIFITSDDAKGLTVINKKKK